MKYSFLLGPGRFETKQLVCKTCDQSTAEFFVSRPGLCGHLWPLSLGGAFNMQSLLPCSEPSEASEDQKETQPEMAVG